MKKLKVIIVHFRFSPYGGGEVVAYNTYKILKKNGVDAYFFSTDQKPYYEENYEYSKYFYNIPEKKKGLLNYLKRIPNAYYNKDAAKQFEKMLDDIKPDVVHLHTQGILTYSILKPCFDRNIPVVKTEHSANPVCPPDSLLYRNETYCKKHLCAKGNYLYCIKNKCQKNDLYASLTCSISNFVNDKTGYNNKISKFISPSLALKKLIIEKGIKANKIEVIDNFFDEKFAKLTPDYTNDGYFLFSGRLYNFKGIRILMDAIKTLPRDINFHIAGTGPLENEIKEFCKKNKLSNVKFIGFLPQEELLEEYKKCIALIVPSIWFEIFGLITIEAFACGKPVIASNIGALGDLVEHDKTGYLFEPENSDELAYFIKHLWQNQEQAIIMGKAAREKAIKNYTEEIYYKRITMLYDSIIKNK